MRIVNENDGYQELSNVTLFLKPFEMKELFDTLGILLSSNDRKSHQHCDSVDYDKLITVAFDNDDVPEDN